MVDISTFVSIGGQGGATVVASALLERSLAILDDFSVSDVGLADRPMPTEGSAAKLQILTSCGHQSTALYWLSPSSSVFLIEYPVETPLSMPCWTSLKTSEGNGLSEKRTFT